MCVGGGGGDRGDDRDVRTRYGRRSVDKSESEDKDEDKEDKDEDKNTYVGVLADGLRHAGGEAVGRERVAAAQAELCVRRARRRMSRQYELVHGRHILPEW